MADELARIDEVADALVAVIETAWTAAGKSAEDLVGAEYDLDLDTAKLSGRQVYIFPSSYTGSPATRGEDEDSYTLVLLVAEKYPDGGAIDKSWVRSRTRWCEWLLDLIGNPRTVRLLPELDEDEQPVPDTGLWPQEAEVTTVYDVEELSERRLFLSVLSVTYREHAD